MTILGYSHDVPRLMRAADLLVTKAGPGTLAEASIAEVPVVVYDSCPVRNAATSTTCARTGSASSRSRRRRRAFGPAHRDQPRTVDRDARTARERRAARQFAPHRRIDREHRADRQARLAAAAAPARRRQPAPRSLSDSGTFPASGRLLSEYFVAHQSQNSGYAPSSRLVFEQKSAPNPETTQVRQAPSRPRSSRRRGGRPRRRSPPSSGTRRRSRARPESTLRAS